MLAFAQFHRAGDGNHVLIAQSSGLFVEGGIALGIDDNLSDAAAVAQIDEKQVAMVAAAIDPAHQHSLFARVGSAESTAHVGSL